ncbi:hypothetical protein SUGI_0812110 [Cryptomeria japonica]|nr:hypothetical protein SUGI_0812110 [Cryptomeria japonica]
MKSSDNRVGDPQQGRRFFGTSGFEKIKLFGPKRSSAEVLLYGGQVTSWKSENGEELLFMSSKAVFKPPKPVRGGIAICFPQFGNLGSLETHGFARSRMWVIDPDPQPPPTNEMTAVDLLLKPTNEDMKIWPHNFELRLRVTLGAGKLQLTSRVRNTDNKPFTFTLALHTHLSVSDISDVRVEGLETLDYFDNLQDRQRFTDQGDSITFDCEVDRIYLSTPQSLAVIDHEKKTTFVLRKTGFPDAAVWNPWIKKSKALVDFGDDEYLRMVCIEAAAVEKPIALKPGEEWTGRQELEVVSSNYFSGQMDPVNLKGKS